MTEAIIALVDRRSHLRRAKDWAAADAVRDELLNKYHVIVEDSKTAAIDGSWSSTWRYQEEGDAAPWSSSSSSSASSPAVKPGAKPSSALLRAVCVGRWRYAVPRVVEQETKIKAKFAGQTLLRTLALMWRLKKGEQEIEEAEAFWRGEIEGGRVLHRTSVLDPTSHSSNASTVATTAPATATRIIKVGDRVRVTKCRHERVVPAVRIDRRCGVLYEDSDVVVIDKPAGVACALSGTAEANSLLAVAGEGLGLSGLKLAHRLDVGVTGCLVLGKTVRAANRAFSEIKRGAEGGVRKVYLARVRGELPAGLRATGAQQRAKGEEERGQGHEADLCRVRLSLLADACGGGEGAHPGERRGSGTAAPKDLSDFAASIAASWRLEERIAADRPDYAHLEEAAPVLRVTSAIAFDNRRGRAVVVAVPTAALAAERKQDQGQEQEQEDHEGGAKQEKRGAIADGKAGAAGAAGAAASAAAAAAAPARLSGRPSATRFRWVATLPDGTHLMHCQPETGRRHQVRCHLASIGLPIANDTVYCDSAGIVEAVAGEEGEEEEEEEEDGQDKNAGAGRCDEASVRLESKDEASPPSSNSAALYEDDDEGTLAQTIGPRSAAFCPWCPKCQWTSSVLAGTRKAPDPPDAEIWLRSWHYTLPAIGVDAVSPLPPWARVERPR